MQRLITERDSVLTVCQELKSNLNFIPLLFFNCNQLYLTASGIKDFHSFIPHVNWKKGKKSVSLKKAAKTEEQNISPRIVNTDLLAFSLDWWIGPIFIVCFNAFTDSKPGCSAHFSLTDLGILPSVWFGQSNKQEMGCNYPRNGLFSQSVCVCASLTRKRQN